jgi:hypothetical protein
MAAHKWADLAQRLGEQFAPHVVGQPAVQTLWVSDDEDGVELWVVTAATEKPVGRDLYGVAVSLERQFPEADIRLHILNRRNFPCVDLDARLAERAHLIARFAESP